jgi:2-oxoglutarate ferredoxin oxidoreductase subunit delta
LPSGTIKIDPELCKDCRLCIHICPNQLIVTSEQRNPKGYCPASFTGNEARKGERTCTGCSLCAISCPEVAIEVYRG